MFPWCSRLGMQPCEDSSLKWRGYIIFAHLSKEGSKFWLRYTSCHLFRSVACFQYLLSECSVLSMNISWVVPKGQELINLKWSVRHAQSPNPQGDCTLAWIKLQCYEAYEEMIYINCLLFARCFICIIFVMLHNNLILWMGTKHHWSCQHAAQELGWILVYEWTHTFWKVATYSLSSELHQIPLSS